MAGIEHRRNSGDPAQWSADRLVRIGASDEGPAAVGRIRSVIADEDGNVYVADNIAGEIRVFDEAGMHVSSFGRKGEGPGEFKDLYSLAWLGSEIAAMDPGNARIGLFTRDGVWLEGIRHYPLTGPGTLVRLHPLGADGFYAPVIDSRRAGLPFVRITREGAADTIGAPRAPDAAPRFWSRCDRPDGGVQGISIPDAPTV
ncbi:MAG: 6-bladed beta-propeller, partial [Gemmatimonadota bacterium]